MITARLKSTRLSKKAIKLLKGRPMVSHLIERLKMVKNVDGIVLCTSASEQDDPLVEIAFQERISCFRGHPDDVLLRLTMAAEKFKGQTIISCTADNPFVDPVYIANLLDYHVANGNDFTSILGLPFGTFSYGLSYSAMVRACKIKDEVDTEVWGGYFTQTGIFKCGILKVQDESVKRPELRLTVDTPEDFELVSRIFDHLYHDGEVFLLREIVKLCDEHPELMEINKSVVQKPGKKIKLLS
ncbi:MAG: 3-deoxy-manno-octulosonate cytidylyltransferase [Desulfobacteraceae bacterium]|nr:3-deoxy-manno-octulosonate cytidylyltransferase [Desulfobacteraceae bacterium]